MQKAGYDEQSTRRMQDVDVLPTPSDMLSVQNMDRVMEPRAHHIVLDRCQPALRTKQNLAAAGTQSEEMQPSSFTDDNESERYQLECPYSLLGRSQTLCPCPAPKPVKNYAPGAPLACWKGTRSGLPHSCPWVRPATAPIRPSCPAHDNTRPAYKYAAHHAAG